MIPGYVAHADGDSVEEIVTSAGSNLILTYCGGKAIKVGWKISKNTGAKFTSVLKPKMTKITWGMWSDLPKVTYKGKEYAKIGKYYYTQHAIEHMTPKNVALEYDILEKCARCIPSKLVEETIQYGSRKNILSHIYEHKF